MAWPMLRSEFEMSIEDLVRAREGRELKLFIDDLVRAREGRELEL